MNGYFLTIFFVAVPASVLMRTKRVPAGIVLWFSKQ